MHELLQKHVDSVLVAYKQRDALITKLPQYASTIAGHYVSDVPFNGNLANYYKDMQLRWGIDYCEYFGETGRVPTQYHGIGSAESVGLCSVYLNSLSLFKDECYSYAEQELGKVVDDVECFHYDYMNSTFYFLPEQLDAGLQKIYTWYNSVKSKTDSILKEKQIKELEKQLQSLKG